jgi:Fe-S cluster biogenesis protein NfuA
MTETILTVKTERTPNPNSLKYNLGRQLMSEGSNANFPNMDSAERSPLAKRIFNIKGIVSVFIGNDFVTITREENINWDDINQNMAPVLEDFFESGEAVVEGVKPVADKEIGADTENPETIEQIKQLIDEKVRPAVAQDGGDIIYRGFEKGIVYLEMLGACSGCPSSGITLKNGVETMLKHYCPDVLEVRAI